MSAITSCTVCGGPLSPYIFVIRGEADGAVCGTCYNVLCSQNRIGYTEQLSAGTYYKKDSLLGAWVASYLAECRAAMRPKEAPCPIVTCARPNYIGAKACWWCGTSLTAPDEAFEYRVGDVVTCR